MVCSYCFQLKKQNKIEKIVLFILKIFPFRKERKVFIKFLCEFVVWGNCFIDIELRLLDYDELLLLLLVSLRS